ncbi:pro-neuregulin-3, membrane-bound isoform [Megalops cyprinoides]|uniref:pro-neuregulin-3, membrane-bound isoform n=1 Tax=Megalops cyprinoides TaxID=118141 RepID=UPI001865335C|nr:pro-neuregulin-3, membrane-bound isoform [Megalops cyprinoides]
MSEMSGAIILEEREGAGGSVGQATPPEAERGRGGGCRAWPRQQTWLCAVPLLIGCVGLGLSLMLLRWIVAGSGPDYLPTDLVDVKGMGQDPIFLSKPSVAPKSPDTPVPTPAPTSPPTPSPSSTARARTRAGSHPNGTTGGRTPHLHNRIGTRITTTTRAPRTHPPAGRDVTPRSTTVRRVGQGSGRNGVPPPRPGTTTTASPSPPARDSTHTRTHERSPKTPASTPTRPHLHVKTVAPTSPHLRSEHFKPCRDKDLAYCLNEGECFIIETLTGSHKHCRCKEGYQGVRCDQFLPKTDSILSDPSTSDHLGIEFMESKDMYKRQVLSVSCITVGISLLGMLCVALYCRNKRQREKLQAHLKESLSPKMSHAPALTSEHSSGVVCALGYTSKSSPRLPCGLQPHKCCKGHRSPPAEGGTVCESVPQSSPSLPAKPRAPPTKKTNRSSPLSSSPDQRHRKRDHHRTVLRRTPPISRARINPIGSSRDSSHAYQHLQEVEASGKEVESLRGPSQQDVGVNMQPALSSRRGGGNTELQCACVGRAAPPSLHNRSVPIIPSFQGQDDVSCMQTVTPEGGASPRDPHPPESAPTSGSEITLLEEPDATPITCTERGVSFGVAQNKPPESQLVDCTPLEQRLPPVGQ